MPPRRATHRALPTGLALVLVAACAGDDPAPDPPADEVEQDQGDEDPATDATDPDETEAEDEPSEALDDVDAEEDADAADDPEPVEVDLDVELQLTDVAVMRAPIAGAAGPDGTLYLAERAGTVHPLTEDGVGGPVVDISDRTATDGERGLLGLAFAADGSELYVSSTDASGDTLISAFAVVDGEIDGSEERTVYTHEQPYSNHNGGDIHVGPDGMLYIAMGDGGAAGDPLDAGQDLSTALGALLRIDPLGGDPYAVPDDNPFVDDPAALDEIHSYGLRNPWRFSFDRATDDLWIADVGQSTREEINRSTFDEAPGANYGWNLMEGTTSYAGEEPDDHVPPIHEYDTTSQRCAITGGFVYRGAAIPALTGVYLYTDYCDSTVRALHLDPEGEVVEERALDIAGSQVVSFVQDADGELYLLDFGGAVRRIDPA